MRRNFLMLILVALLVLGLSASVFAQTTLRIAWWGSQDRHDRTLKVIEMFEENYPDISIEPEFVGWDGYWEKIAAQAAGSNLPDIMQHDYAFLEQYTSRGLLVDLTEYVESGDLDFTNIADQFITGGMVDGGLYGVNLGANAMVTIFDPVLFEEAGVEVPTTDWTWEDYMNKVETIHEELGIYGDFGVPQVPMHGFQYYLRQLGYDLYNEEGTGLAYDDDQLFVDFFTMDLELTSKGALAPMDYRTEVGDSNPEEKLIIEKEAAMESNIFSNQIVALESAAGRELKMMIPPKHKDQVENGLYIKPSQFFSVTKDTDSPDAAVKFINFVTNDLEANKILMAERGVPISSEIREGLLPYLDSVQQRTFDYVNMAAEHASPISPPNPEGHNQIENELGNIHQMLFYDILTLEEAAVEFRNKANEILGN